jgi:predicted RNA-binding Zn-ribbon protein involved in translation (DUF1610 family)
MTTEQAPQSHCVSCGFEAPSGGAEWQSVDTPSLGTLTQCPNCGSTDIRTGIEI